MNIPSYRTIQQAIRKLDPSLTPDNEGYKVSAILLSSLYVGPNVRAIARLTSLPHRFVAEVGRRLRANHVWVGAKVAGSEWFEEETGGAAFWLDVNVGLGYLARSAA